MKPTKAVETKLRRDALQMMRAALDAADAGNAVRHHFSRSRKFINVGRIRLEFERFDRIFLLSVGKAAVPMAAAVEEILGDSLNRGLVVTKQGHGGSRLNRCTVFEAGHPIPNQAGENASQLVQALLRELNARDLLVVAISGGASAILVAPAAPITLAAKQKTTDLLLRAGADIYDLNTVRKHLSSSQRRPSSKPRISGHCNRAASF